jgi:hypothetical protein
MNKLIARSIASLLLSAMTLGPFAQAQSPERIIKANIPFEFSVGNRIFPAGRYALVRSEPFLLELRDPGGRVLASFLTQSVQARNAPAQPRLLFDNEGGGHALTQVWQENDSIGQQLQPSKSATRAVQKATRHVQTAQVSNPR